MSNIDQSADGIEARMQLRKSKIPGRHFQVQDEKWRSQNAAVLGAEKVDGDVGRNR
jgi:hypothetical protein